MSYFVGAIRLFVGVLFIFSGLVKLNDPMGFAFKLEDYFAPDVLNLSFLTPFALPLAIFIVIVEIVLGIMLLVGYKINLTLYSLLAMIVFFTFLTFYSAYFNKVTDCGCFGDAIPLTPWQSFAKDIILLIAIVVLIFFKSLIRPLIPSHVSAITVILSIIAMIVAARYVLHHLPLIDFRPYAVGKSIIEGMKSAEELGLESPRYMVIYTLKNQQTGETREVNSDEYISQKWWEREDWKILTDKTRTVRIKKGYEPPIHDFKIVLDGEDITDQILSEDHLMLVIMYDINKTDRSNFSKINDLATYAESRGARVLGITGSSKSEFEPVRHDVQAAYPWATCDMTTLKTMIRSNPGVMILSKGTVHFKFSHRDVPSIEKAELMRLFQ